MPVDLENGPRLFQLPTTDKFRVSLCRLEDEAWHEQGLGLVSCERRDADDTTWLVVENEKRPSEVLMRCAVRAPLSFRKQDTLLFCAAPRDHIKLAGPSAPKPLHNDNNGIVRLALCFQELTGCATVCDFLVCAAHAWAPGVTVAVQYASSDSGADVDLELVAQPPPLPPLPTLENAESVVKTVLQALRMPLGREFLGIYLDQVNFLDHMHALFVEMEHADSDVPAIERIRTLWALSEIMKQYFLIGDAFLIDSMVQSDQFVKVIGILEYDRAFGSRKANFRDYYCNHTELKQVVEINDTPVLEKIRRTFRLQLMRDILVRSADDFPFQILKTLIYINQVDIIDSLQNSTTFCDDLFGLFEDCDDAANESADDVAYPPSPQRQQQSRKELRQQGLKFINEVVKISKTFTMPQMRVLYENLTDYGLFDILNYAMAREQPLEPKVLVLESLGVLLDFDPQLAARHFIPTVETLTRVICEPLPHEPVSAPGTRMHEPNASAGMVSAMQIQACELLKKLMAEEPKLATETFFKQVSRHLADDKDIISAESVQQILEIVSCSYLRAPAQTLRLIVDNKLWQRLASTHLIQARSRDSMPDSGVVIAVTRAVHNAMQPAILDETEDLVEQSKQLIETELIGKVVELLVKLGNVNDMVHSSCLSLLSIITDGYLRGEPQFSFVARWIASEKREDALKLRKTLPNIVEMLELADAGDATPKVESHSDAQSTGPSLPTSRQRPANRKRSTSSELLPTPKPQRPRVHIPSALHTPALHTPQHASQHAPIDEVDSQDASQGSLPGFTSRLGGEQGRYDLSDIAGADEAPFADGMGELLARDDEIAYEYIDQGPLASPTSPTAVNSSYWSHAAAPAGSGVAARRAFLLHGAAPGGGSEEADYV